MNTSDNSNDNITTDYNNSVNSITQTVSIDTTISGQIWIPEFKILKLIMNIMLIQAVVILQMIINNLLMIINKVVILIHNYLLIILITHFINVK